MTAKELAYDERLGLYLWQGRHSQTGEQGLWINGVPSARPEDAEINKFIKEHKDEVVAAIRDRNRSLPYLLASLCLLIPIAWGLGPVAAAKFLAWKLAKTFGFNQKREVK